MHTIKQSLKRITPDFIVLVRQHWREHGSPHNIFNPQSFNQKILYRLLFDRRPVLTQFADKYAVREYVEKKLGLNVLAKLYHVTKNPSDIPFDALPEQFVVKPTHGSGWVRIVTDKHMLDRNDLIRTCKSWLSQSFYKKSREWVYKNIEPQIVIEEYINEGTGNPPKDYKFFVFHGKVALVQVDDGRFTDHRRDLYTPTWERLDATYHYQNIAGGVPRPKHLDEMIRAAEILGSEIDFIRADFYDTDSKIYFGELTTTPCGGLESFCPHEIDLHLGALWNQHTSGTPVLFGRIARLISPSYATAS